jgi:hypothetical protein
MDPKTAAASPTATNCTVSPCTTEWEKLSHGTPERDLLDTPQLELSDSVKCVYLQGGTQELIIQKALLLANGIEVGMNHGQLAVYQHQFNAALDVIWENRLPGSGWQLYREVLLDRHFCSIEQYEQAKQGLQIADASELIAG